MLLDLNSKGLYQSAGEEKRKLCSFLDVAILAVVAVVVG